MKAVSEGKMMQRVVGATRVRSANAMRALATDAPVSTSYDKMEKDKRYRPVNEVPDTVTSSIGSGEIHSPGFSIKGEAREGRPAYLDLQATTPLDPRVMDAMMPFMTEGFGNPHSRTHSYGWEAENAVEEARKQVADLIGATPKEIIFTSGATESNNISVKGIARFYAGRKKHVITTQTEHKCVLDSCRDLEQDGFEITYLPVDSSGLVNMDEFKAAVRPDTVLASVMAVNNEIGVVQPLKELGEFCRANKIFFHTDAAQMLGKMPIFIIQNSILRLAGLRVRAIGVSIN